MSRTVAGWLLTYTMELNKGMGNTNTYPLGEKRFYLPLTTILARERK
jgi:hypothetical protein